MEPRVSACRGGQGDHKERPDKVRQKRAALNSPLGCGVSAAVLQYYCISCDALAFMLSGYP